MMSTRVISERVAHVWLDGNLRIIRLGSTFGETCSIVGIAVNDQLPYHAWIGLKDGEIYKVQISLEEAHRIIELNSTSHSIFFQNAGIGQLLTLAYAPSTQGIDIFGTDGWTSVSDDGVQESARKWPDAMRALEHVVMLHKGSLRNATVPTQSKCCAVLMCDVSGRVSLLGGTSVSEILRDRKGRFAVIGDLFQPVLRVEMNKDLSMAVILGALRGILVLHVTKENKVSCMQSMLRADNAERMSPSTVRVRKFEDRRVVFEEENSRYVTNFFQDTNTSEVKVFRSAIGSYAPAPVPNEDGPLRALGEEDMDEENVAQSLAEILRGIEKATELNDAVQHRADLANNQIMSFNSALLFAMQSKTSAKKGVTDTGTARVTCSFTGALSAEPSSPQFYVPSTWDGVNAFVNVALTNNTSISIGEGWNLKLTIENRKQRDLKLKKPDSDEEMMSAEENEEGIRDVPYLPKVREMPSQVIVMNCAVERLPSNEQKKCSFPIVLSSHAPKYISASLCFTFPDDKKQCDMNEGIFADSAHILNEDTLELPLASRHCMDVLSFSQASSDGALRADTSHLALRSVRILQCLNPERVRAMEPLRLTSQLELPFPVSLVRTALSLSAESDIPSAFRSFLGAEYSIETTSSNENNNAPERTRVILRAVAHVLPFLRAAVLQRVVNAVRSSNNYKFVLGASSTTAAEKWERKILDGANEALPALRAAQNEVMAFRRLVKEIDEENRLELCENELDHEAAKKTVHALQNAQDVWMEKMNDMWNPQ